MRRGWMCWASFVPEVGPCGSCWASFVPDTRRGRVSRESFVSKGPGAVVVGRVVLCSGVVLVPVGGRSALAPLMGTGAGPSGSAGALHDGGDGGFALHEALLRRVAGVSNPRVVQFPPIGGAAVHIQRTYSSAPPGLGRGVTTSSNQAFCSAPCAANMRITMIELLSAWNSHE